MKNINSLDWDAAAASLNENSYALIPQVLDIKECHQLSGAYDDPGLYRKTITMERYRFGKGEYKYFSYPLPPLIQTIRETVYPKLVPVANAWMKALNDVRSFPASLSDLQQQCRAYQQDKPTVLILKYGPGGHNTLHQDLYGENIFPIQVAFLLSEPGKDFTGGEFVLTEQRPRMQSRAEVVSLEQGDGVAFAVSHRPVQGTKGVYRVNLRHGVSRLRSGHRNTMGIIFHDGK